MAKVGGAPAQLAVEAGVPSHDPAKRPTEGAEEEEAKKGSVLWKVGWLLKGEGERA